MLSMRTSVVVSVVAPYLWNLICADATDIWCGWNASCVLVASFPVGDDVVIHWIQEAPGGVQVQVHSFYYDTDQLANQGKHFRERTSLFKENIKGGNASLLLKDVVFDDEGRYKCYVGTLQETWETFINLHVEAPIQEVRMELSGKSVFCRADGIYPVPTLEWSTDPPMDGGLFDNKTKVEQTQLGFYDVESCMQLKADGSIHVDFTCEVSSERDKKQAWLRIEDALRVTSGTEVKVPCSFPTEVDTFDLIWKIHHSDHILSMKMSGPQHHLALSDKWKMHVIDGASAWRHLKLPNVEPEHQGTYTCEVRTHQVNYVTQTDVIVIPDSKLAPLLATIGLFSCLLVVSIGTMGFFIDKVMRMRKSRKTPEEDDSDNKLQAIEKVADTTDTERQNFDFLSFSVIRQRLYSA